MSAFPLRRLIPIAACVALLLAAPVFLTADEGEWLPEQLAELDFGPLRARGLELTAEQLWNGEEGLLSAAVQINGCSASFVSEEGLIVTNHHCGFAAINSASTLERNLLEDGFVSADRSEEIPAPGYAVSFVRRYEDVTAAIHDAADAAGDDPAERFQAVQRKRQELEAEARTPTTNAIVVPYFEGREWRRIWRTVLRDVRLVYAPPRSVGEYGGETDNWMWPRHTGDFCFFRAYVGPDGSSAAYSEDNVPFAPPRHLQVAAEGIEEGDLVMILGYPGKTERYLSSVAVAGSEEWYFPRRREVFGAIHEALHLIAAENEEIALQVQSTIKSIANVLKNADGMVWGLARNRVVERKLAEEAAFRTWLAEDSSRQDRHGEVLDDLLALDLRIYERQRRDYILETMQRRAPGFGRMIRQALGGQEVRDLEASSGQQLEWDLAVLPLLLRWADELPDDQRIEAVDSWQAKGGVDNGYAALASSLVPEIREWQAFRGEVAGLRMDVGARWIAAQEEFRGQRFYPDANSTLRVSFASVKGYEPRDGVHYSTHTTVDGAIAKHTDEGEFDMPDEILSAVEDDPTRGGIHVCFLADGDTTGGNSGSPVVNGRGELVGLNFDRVYENVAGDFGWNEARSRNISVDMSYVLWLMREVWPAPNLLEEMGLDT